MDFNFRDFKLFEKMGQVGLYPTGALEKTDDNNLSSWYDFVFAYFICLGAMWTVLIVINNTFWFLPIFWYFGAKPIESAIKNYYVTTIPEQGRFTRYLL